MAGPAVRQHQPAPDPLTGLSREGLAVDATQEQWRPVGGFEGFYEVSDRGRIRSVARVISRGLGPYTVRERIRRPSKTRTGHLSIGLYRDGQCTQKLVHQVVLGAFVGPCPSGMECCHNNGNPADNRLGNLRWDSRSANNLDAVKHGTHHNAKKSHCIRGHEFTPENATLSARGGRRCRQCVNQRARERWLSRERSAAEPRPRQTQCKWGHEMTPENTYVHVERGIEKHRCKECSRNRVRQRRARQREG